MTNVSNRQSDHPIRAATATAETDREGREPATRLRTVLRVNAAFSTVTGLIATIDAGPVSRFFGIEQTWIIRSIGLALLGFAIDVLWLSGRRTETVRSLSWLVSIADLAWVVGTVAIIAAGWLTPGGNLTMALIGVVVLGLAVGQLRARSRLGGSSTSMQF